MKNIKDSNKKMKKKGNPVVNLVRTEWKYLGSLRGRFILYSFLFVIAGLLELSQPLIIGTVFNTIQESITSESQLQDLVMLISLLLVVEIGFWIFHGTARVLEERTGFHVNKNYQNDKIRKILELPMKWHKDHHSGDTIDKVNKGSAAIDGFAKYTTFQIIYAVLQIVASVIILFIVDFRAGAIALAFSVTTIYAITLFDKKLHTQYKQLNKYGNKVSSAVFDYLSNITTVITLRLKKPVRKEIDERLGASYPLYKKNTRLNELKWAFASISIVFMTVLVLVIYSVSEYRNTGVIMIGTLYILYGYLARVGDTFHNVAQLYGRIVAYDANIESAKPIDEEFDKVGSKRKLKLNAGWNSLEFNGVDFSHHADNSKMHLDKVDFSMKKGEKIALVGESGSGKSTILTLIRGLNIPSAGEVLVDGEKSIYGFDRIKHAVTLIPQEPELFNNTIKYNISLGLPASKDEIKEAVKLAQFEKVLNRLENGLNTNVLEKGVSLSGGEKQRLALARGILAARKSDIVLMDEPTSSVDSANEVKIYKNVFRAFKDKTVLSSIHRLHLLNLFDRVYLFDKGKVVASGTLEEMKKNKKFMKLWKKSMIEDKKEGSS